MELWLVLIPIFFLGFFPPSYVVLRMVGVKESLVERSIKFACVVAVIQVFSGIIFALIFGQPQILLSNIVALLITYKYVQKVLHISVGKNIAITVFLPLLSWCLVIGIYLVIFN